MYDTVIEIAMRDGIPVVCICNEVDLANAAVLQRYLDEALENHNTFVISLEQCRYIDSSGLRPIIRLAERAGAGFFIVVPEGTQIRRIFNIAALHERMHVCATVEEALARVTRAAAKGLVVA